MNEGPVSCLPMNSKMSKVKKALEEARETHTRELDLVDKNVISFDEMPGLCKFTTKYVGNAQNYHIWTKIIKLFLLHVMGASVCFQLNSNAH